MGTPNGGRKRRAVRTEIVPDFVHTADYRETSLLATSDAVLKSHEKRRGTPLLVPKTVKMFGLHKYSAKELLDLRVDTRYQREEVTTEVNQFIIILKAGGIIPDPISVAVRKYGDGKSYIVDGQQRWWAHVDTGTPIYGMEYHVGSYEDEVALFHAFNSQTRVSPENKLRSLPGPLGETIRRLNEDELSPIVGKVSFKSAGNAPGTFGGMALARGLLSVISNTSATGGIDNVSPIFDRNYKSAPRHAEKFVDAYVALLSHVFRNQRLNSLAAVAFGRVCWAAYTANKGEPVAPTPRQLDKLAQTDWSTIAPSHAIKWLPVLLDEITKIWPVEVIREKR